MGWMDGWREAWSRVAGMRAEGAPAAVSAEAGEIGLRKTVGCVGSGWGPHVLGGGGMRAALPKANPVNLRRMAETPAARRAISCIKNRVACLGWRVEAVGAAPGEEAAVVGERERRARAVERALRAPNGVDSFRTLIEAVVEDLLVVGAGAVEMEATGDPARPVRLYPVDAATVQVNAAWNGEPGVPRFGQATGRVGQDAVVPLLDEQMLYARLNPRTHSTFGLGKLEVAFETVNQFLQAHRYAGRLAGNGVVQYALWLNERTPEQRERLIQWWQDEVEGTGRVPVLSSPEKPEVLRFAGGTDADLRLAWQEFLLVMVANAFDLPPMLLGVVGDVNKSTAAELAEEAFQNAVKPVATLLAEHLTRDVIAKRLGWDDLRFVWNDLESRDEATEVEIQTKLLAAGVLTVDEVRDMRGLEPLQATDVAGSRGSAAEQAAVAGVPRDGREGHATDAE